MDEFDRAQCVSELASKKVVFEQPKEATREGCRLSAPVSLTVLCVKFCKGGHGWLESCGLAELNFLVLFEIVHIEIAVGFEPVLVGFDG